MEPVDLLLELAGKQKTKMKFQDFTRISGYLVPFWRPFDKHCSTSVRVVFDCGTSALITIIIVKVLVDIRCGSGQPPPGKIVVYISSINSLLVYIHSK